MEDKFDLEKILAQLGSDEAKRKAISKLVGKIKIPKKLVEKTIRDYEETERFGDAAYVAMKAGLLKKAIQNYEKAKLFEDAAYAALKAGMEEIAIQNYEKAGLFGAAAYVALKIGLTERARDLERLANLI